ncbi:hypothetical protein IFM89_002941 [Coptis chinensis]|uniref:Uncharacterized protein n=1 Tax=Coptis chinensis TaxID=261450 RepID=A0A835IJC0_9MAGN|nr:hypothetical protein IFM89_002941 [Coptis chinensis]
MVEKADEDKEFVAGPKRRIGDKKPAATRRNRGQTRLKPKLITDVLKPQRANCRAGKSTQIALLEFLEGAVSELEMLINLILVMCFAGKTIAVGKVTALPSLGGSGA